MRKRYASSAGGRLTLSRFGSFTEARRLVADMGTLATRLQRLEKAREAQETGRWEMVELRPIGDGLWQDDAGNMGTADELSERYPPRTIIVMESVVGRA